MFANRRIWFAYLIVFICSTCTLVIELVAGRILAPYIGVSLYTWTSIIGVVLAGISLGNYLGGLLADRRASRETLALIVLAGGLSSASVLASATAIFSFQWQLPMIGKILLSTAAVFFLPAVILGMVTPVVIKLALSDLNRTGNTVGSIYAVSTAGSILGTFLTGFWLISWFGTRAIVWGVAVVLLALGLAIGRFWRPRERLATIGGTGALVGVAAWGLGGGAWWLLPSDLGAAMAQVTAGLAVAVAVALVAVPLLAPRVIAGAAVAAVFAYGLVYVGWSSGHYQAPCLVESNYFCIRVDETTVDGHEVRALVLDHLVHSYVSLDDPTVLGYAYERVYSEVTAYYAERHPELDTLFIGGGGYTFPRYVEHLYPHSTVDVIEIDPVVTSVAREHLDLRPESRIRSFNQDARAFLLDWEEPRRYDLIYGDAFNDLSIPYHLTTVEFNQLVAGYLKETGVYLVNVIDKYEGGEFLKAYVNSLREVFPHVQVLAQGQAWQFPSPNTYVVMAGRQPFDYEDFRRVVGGDSEPLARQLPPDQLANYLSTGRRILLTDDYAPVDQLLARLFAERGY